MNFAFLVVFMFMIVLGISFINYGMRMEPLWHGLLLVGMGISFILIIPVFCWRNRNE